MVKIDIKHEMLVKVLYLKICLNLDCDKLQQSFPSGSGYSESELQRKLFWQHC